MRRHDTDILRRIPKRVYWLAPGFGNLDLVFQEITSANDIAVPETEMLGRAIYDRTLGKPHHQVLAAIAVQQCPIGLDSVDEMRHRHVEDRNVALVRLRGKLNSKLSLGV